MLSIRPSWIAAPTSTPVIDLTTDIDIQRVDSSLPSRYFSKRIAPSWTISSPLTRFRDSTS